jgi:hypothetical protein
LLILSDKCISKNYTVPTLPIDIPREERGKAHKKREHTKERGTGKVGSGQKHDFCQWDENADGDSGRKFRWTSYYFRKNQQKPLDI